MNKILFFLCLFSTSLLAQTDEDLIGYFSFDDNDFGTGIDQGNPNFDCGVIGDALVLDGVDDAVNFAGALNLEFNRIDFSISFFIKPTSLSGTQDIISKFLNCDGNNGFAIRYVPFNQTITAILSENPSKAVLLSAPLSPDLCWQHVAVVRDGTEFYLHINGERVDEGRTSSRADIESTATLSIADSPCVGTTDVRYKGFLDEVRVYNRALTKAEVKELYIKPDDILTLDTLIVLGDDVNINISETCATDFNWSPVEGVGDPKVPNTSIAPPITGEVTYYLNFIDGQCAARDSVVIRVVSPDELDCTEIFLPNAFTPNGDNLNDTYGISNPFVVESLVSFEIFDRWGNRVFFTDDPLGRWDGSYQSEKVNPGNLLYRIIYTCRGEELKKTGSVMLLR